LDQKVFPTGRTFEKVTISLCLFQGTILNICPSSPISNQLLSSILYMKHIILLLGIVAFLSLVSIPLARAASLLDDAHDSVKLINQNTRTIERVTDFTRECTDRIKSDLSVLPICDSLFQKFNIDVGKFYVENQGDIEEIIYPYTLPSSISTFSGQDSADVIGSNEMATVVEHTTIAMGYMDTIATVSGECANLATSYDLSGAKSCINLMNSLNSYFKVFNENGKSEFDSMLDNPTTTTFGDYGSLGHGIYS
jgi:hypothetical protein